MALFTKILKIKPPWAHWLFYFNSHGNLGLSPSIWLCAIINPIPKWSATEKRAPLNYRGILLSTINKLFTCLMACRIRSFLEKKNVLMNEQNDIQPGWSFLNHIFVLNDLVRIRKAQNKKTFCSITSFQKVVDCVNHEYLIRKLALNGIHSRTYHVTKSMYSNPVSCVYVGGGLDRETLCHQYYSHCYPIHK